MKIINLLTLALVIIGAFVWGLVGIFDWNIVQAIFGPGWVSRTIYILVGASGVWQLVPLFEAISTDEKTALGWPR